MINKTKPKSNRSKSREFSLEDSLAPIVWCNRILGIAIFEAPQGTSWPKLSYVYFFIRSLGYILLLWYSEYFIENDVDRYVILKLTFQVILFCNITVMIISSILWHFQRKVFRNLYFNIFFLKYTLNNITTEFRIYLIIEFPTFFA